MKYGLPLSLLFCLLLAGCPGSAEKSGASLEDIAGTYITQEGFVVKLAEDGTIVDWKDAPYGKLSAAGAHTFSTSGKLKEVFLAPTVNIEDKEDHLTLTGEGGTSQTWVRVDAHTFEDMQDKVLGHWLLISGTEDDYFEIMKGEENGLHYLTSDFNDWTDILILAEDGRSALAKDPELRPEDGLPGEFTNMPWNVAAYGEDNLVFFRRYSWQIPEDEDPADWVYFYKRIENATFQNLLARMTPERQRHQVFANIETLLQNASWTSDSMTFQELFDQLPLQERSAFQPVLGEDYRDLIFQIEGGEVSLTLSDGRQIRVQYDSEGWTLNRFAEDPVQ
ncbi:MAG: hypothetical protein ACFB20_03685 [Opitutales bacterium]